MPSQKIAEIAFAKQSAKGTIPTLAQYRTAVTGGDIAPLLNVPDFAETGTNRLPRTSFVASAGVDGNPAMGVRDDVLPLLLYGALGTKAVSGAGDPWTHTITPANSLPYFTFWRMLGDLTWEKFEDCKIASFELSSEIEQALTMTITVVGTKARALSSAVYATEATAAPLAGVGETGTGLFVHHHGSGFLTVEGVVVSRMERVAVTISNGSARQFGDSVFADDVSEGAQEITVATRQRVTDAAAYNRLHYASATPSTGTAQAGAILELGAGYLDLKWRRQTTPERSVRFTSGNRVQLVSIGGRVPGTGNDPLREEPTYRVMQPDSGVAFSGIVLNDVTTY